MNTPTHVSMLNPRAALVLAGLFAAGAFGQVSPVEPFWALVVSPDAVMRSGDKEQYYPVATLPAGQMVHVDGEGGGWSRIEYPKGTTAFIPSDAVTPGEGGKSVTLSRPEKARAARLDTAKAVGSWRTLGETPLPAGTSLILAFPTPLEDSGGKSAYRIVPPDSARGYVSSAALQRATPDQVSAYLHQSGGGTPAPAPAVTPETPGAPQPVAQAPVAPPPTPREPTLLDRLDSAFKTVQEQEIEKAEFNELIAEYEKALADMPEDPLNQRTRARMSQRIDVLRLRAEYQKQRADLLAEKPDLTGANQRAAAVLADLDKVRTYDAVGRLSASAIYDGKRLPLMYRVQSVGSSLPRTIGYVKPGSMDLESKVGMLVGVVGAASLDPDLKLKIITPTRVDLLQAQDTRGPAPVTPETPPAAPPEAPPPTTGG